MVSLSAKTGVVLALWAALLLSTASLVQAQTGVERKVLLQEALNVPGYDTALASVTCLTCEQSDLLVGRSCQAALFAEFPSGSYDVGNALRPALEAADEPDHTDVGSDRRDDHRSIVAPELCRHGDVSVPRRDGPERATREASAASCKLQLALLATCRASARWRRPTSRALAASSRRNGRLW